MTLFVCGSPYDIPGVLTTAYVAINIVRLLSALPLHLPGPGCPLLELTNWRSPGSWEILCEKIEARGTENPCSAAAEHWVRLKPLAESTTFPPDLKFGSLAGKPFNTADLRAATAGVVAACSAYLAGKHGAVLKLSAAEVDGALKHGLTTGVLILLASSHTPL